MIFSCGETYEAYLDRVVNWHPYYAWWPTKVEHINGRRQYAWLQWIECKRGVYSHMYGWLWEYRIRREVE